MMGAGHSPDNKNYRKSVRAPLRRPFLFLDDDHNVFKAKTENISIGGLLIAELPCIPKSRLTQIYAALPQHPDYQSLSARDILGLKPEKIPMLAFRVSIKLIRKASKESDLEQIINAKFGCEFVALQTEQERLIRNYTENFARNVAYLLNMMESSSNNENTAKLVRTILVLMDYDAEAKLAILRQKLLHDYNNLTIL